MVRKNCVLVMAVAILCFITMPPYAFGETRVFRGKIIDSDTRMPLKE